MADPYFRHWLNSMPRKALRFGDPPPLSRTFHPEVDPMLMEDMNPQERAAFEEKRTHETPWAEKAWIDGEWQAPPYRKLIFKKGLMGGVS